MTDLAKIAHRAYLPFVAGPPLPKAGLAASSTNRLDERVAMLSGKLGFIRGWQLGDTIPEQQAGLPYVPCLWGAWYWQSGGDKIREQLHVLDKLGPGYSGRLLFLNEPDLSLYDRHGQAEVTPRGAAQLYLHAKSKLPHAKLVGPGVSHIDYQNDWQWARAFIGGVVTLSGRAPVMWAWDTHTYITDEPPLAIINSYEAMLANCGIVGQRYFISEWAACTAGRVTEMKRAFDGDGRIIGHAYYDQWMATWDGSGRCTMLFDESEPLRLSALGMAFRDAI